MDDVQLLKQYVKDGSQEAFAGIVAGHVDLVYGTARRLVGDEQLAEDVAQAAFLVLAQKAKQVEAGRLAGWLVNAVRLAAHEARRSKLCREKHEWRAAQMRSGKGSVESSADEPTLAELTPLLDEALCRLGEADRTAVAMRFLQGRSFAEVAAAMGLSEEAARKRVERAVEKLRKVFMKKGLAPSVGGLMVVLAAHQAQAAPAGLAGSISAMAISGGAGTGAILAKGAMKMMVLAKVKVAAMVVLMIAGAVGVVIAAQSTTGPVPAAPVTAAPGQVAASPGSRATEEPQQLLQKASQAVAWTKQSFSEKVKLEFRGSLGSTEVGTDSTVERYQCFDGRLHIMCRPTQGLDRGRWVKTDMSLDFLLAADQKYYLWSEAPSDPAYAYVQIMRSKEKMDSLRGFRNGGLRHGHFLEDYYETSLGSGSILDLARSGTTDPAVWTEQIGGVECYRLDAQTKLGHLRMWISPTQGNNVVRYTIEQKADSTGNGPLSVVFEATKVIQVDGQYVIGEGSYEVKDVYEGNNNVQSAKAKRTEIIFNPVFDADVFTTRAVRDGCRALFDDGGKPGIDYVWRDGDAVPKDAGQTVSEWNNMQALFVAITMYANDHNGVCPDKLDDLHMGPALPPLLTNPARPDQHPGYIYVKPAVPLSRVNRQSLILYEAFDTWPTGGVGVCFAGGRCKRISDEATFRRLLKAAEAKP